MSAGSVAKHPFGRYGLILGGLALYVLFLVVQMPAVWLTSRLPQESAFQVRQVEGNLWQGTAAHITWHAGIESLDLGRLRWALQPGEFLNGRVGLAFELGQAPKLLKGVLLLGRDGHNLKAVQGHLDAAVLGFAARSLSLLQAQGSLIVDIPDFHLGENRIHGEVRADWRGARSKLISAPLGDYHVELRADPDGRRARITVHTLQGALTMNGDGDYYPGKGVKGRLILLPPQDERRNLYSPVLNMLGMSDASGAWVLNFDSH